MKPATMTEPASDVSSSSEPPKFITAFDSCNWTPVASEENWTNEMLMLLAETIFADWRSTLGNAEEVGETEEEAEMM